MPKVANANLGRAELVAAGVMVMRSTDLQAMQCSVPNAPAHPQQLPSQHHVQQQPATQQFHRPYQHASVPRPSQASPTSPQPRTVPAGQTDTSEMDQLAQGAEDWSFRPSEPRGRTRAPRGSRRGRRGNWAPATVTEDTDECDANAGW